MSHGIMQFDRFAENRRNGDRAWHKIGDPIREGIDCQTAFVEHGLGWKTELAPIQAIAGNGIINIPGKFAHIRCDTQDVLGVVSDEYKVFENQDLAKLADSLAGADAAVHIETCGTLYNGRQVFCLVKLPHTIRLGKTGSDEVEQYVLVSNGHGGLFSTAVYPTSIRVVCANTLRWSERDVLKGIRFRHTGNFEMKVAQARLVLGTAMEESKKFEALLQYLAAAQLTSAQIDLFFEKTFERIFGKIDTEAEAGFKDKLIAKKAEMMEIWKTNLEDAQQTVDGIGGTAWSAFNAVTQYCDHERGRFRSIDESKARVASNLFGTAHYEKKIAFDNVMKVASGVLAPVGA